MAKFWRVAYEVSATLEGRTLPLSTRARAEEEAEWIRRTFPWYGDIRLQEVDVPDPPSFSDVPAATPDADFEAARRLGEKYGKPLS